MQINWLNVVTGGGAVVLIGSEAIASGAAAAWAVSGLSGFAPTAAMALLAAAVVAGLMATVAFARMAHRIEPFFGPSTSEHPEGAER